MLHELSQWNNSSAGADGCQVNEAAWEVTGGTNTSTGQYGKCWARDTGTLDRMMRRTLYVNHRFSSPFCKYDWTNFNLSLNLT